MRDPPRYPWIWGYSPPLGMTAPASLDCNRHTHSSSALPDTRPTNCLSRLPYSVTSSLPSPSPLLLLSPSPSPSLPSSSSAVTPVAWVFEYDHSRFSNAIQQTTSKVALSATETPIRSSFTRTTGCRSRLLDASCSWSASTVTSQQADRHETSVTRHYLPAIIPLHHLDTPRPLHGPVGIRLAPCRS